MRPRSSLLLLLLSFLRACGQSSSSGDRAASPGSYDVLITGGTVIDGTGSVPYRADVAITGYRIVRVSRSPIERSSAMRVIDATSRIVAPGFIDLHAHLDPLLRLPGARLTLRISADAWTHPA